MSQPLQSSMLSSCRFRSADGRLKPVDHYINVGKVGLCRNGKLPILFLPATTSNTRQIDAGRETTQYLIAPTGQTLLTVGPRTVFMMFGNKSV
jgi:hypothetical protein